MNRAFIQITIHSASIKSNVFNCVKSAYWCDQVGMCKKCARVRNCAQLRRVHKGCVNLRIYAFFAIFVLVWRK